jgi:hypothetical protein
MGEGVETMKLAATLVAISTLAIGMVLIFAILALIG